MSKKFLLVISLILVSAISFSALAEDLKTAQPNDKILGDKDAKITIIEYASLSCGHCANFHKAILPEIKKEYIDTGKAKLIYRDFPLNASALTAAQIANCTASEFGNDKYFSLLGAFFEKQSEWAFDKDFRNKLISISEAFGLKKESIETCLNDKALENKIIEDTKNAAEKLGVKSTPTIFVNGENVGMVNSASVIKDAINTISSGKSLEQERQEAAKNLTGIQESDIILGKKSAPVTVIEYSNISCPHCAETHKNLMKLLQAEYIDTGKVKYAFRELPMNQATFYAYMTAYCKGNDRFYELLGKLVDNLQSWTSTSAFILPLRKLAEKEGISKEEFYSCLENQKIADKINQTHQGATKLGVNHSPAIFVNGKQVDGHGGNQAIIDAIKSAM